MYHHRSKLVKSVVKNISSSKISAEEKDHLDFKY